MPSTFSALSHRNFQLYFGGQLVSVAGTWMQMIAQQWLVYQISGSELTLGLVSFAGAIPALIVSPWGGVVVDRVNRRHLLIATQAAAMILAFAMAALTFLDIVEVWHIIVIAGLMGVVNSFDAPARQAFVVDMVGHEDMSNAIALQSLVFNGARVIGPALGGILLATIGASWCFLINGLSYLAVIASLAAMKIEQHPHSHAPQSPWQQLSGGLRYVGQHPTLLGLILMALVFSIFGISYSTVMPAFVDRVLLKDAFIFGVLNAVTGLGAVTGAVLLAQFSRSARRGRWLLLASILFPVLLILFATVTIYPVTLLFIYGMGVGFLMVYVLINTLLQVHVEDHMRGRVLSLYTLTFYGFSPFGSLAIGAAAETWGITSAITVSAVITLVLMSIILLRVPKIRSLV